MAATERRAPSAERVRKCLGNLNVGQFINSLNCKIPCPFICISLNENVLLFVLRVVLFALQLTQASNSKIKFKS